MIIIVLLLLSVRRAFIISERNGNAFTDDLYDAIRKGIWTVCSEESCDSSGRRDEHRDITERLESPQKEQFTALFVELKIKNVSYFSFIPVHETYSSM